MKKKIIILLVILLIIGMVIYRGLDSDETETAVPRVNTEILERGDITETVEADGRVIIEDEVSVRSDLSGIAAEVYVEEGDRMEMGEPIFKLSYDSISEHFDVFHRVEAEYQQDSTEIDFTEKLLTAQLEREQVSLENLEKNLTEARLSLEEQRISLNENIRNLKNDIADLQRELQEAAEDVEEGKVLFTRNAITEKELQSREKTYENLQVQKQRAEENLEFLLEERKPNTLARAEARVEEVESALREEEIRYQNRRARLEKLISDLVITADKEGTLVDFSLKSGDSVSAGTGVGRIADLENLMVRVMVDEIDINKVSQGQEVEITGDSFSPVLRGKVSKIAPEGETAGTISEFATRIAVENEGGVMRPGMFVSSRIITAQEEDVITVPPIAVLEDEETEEEYIMLFVEGRAEKRIVETGRSELDRVAITGVEAGEEVITGPFTVLRDLEDGQQVRR